MLWCTLNWPGSWSDTALVHELYVLLLELPDSFSIAADLAFKQGDMAACIIRPLKSNELTHYANSVTVKQFVTAVKHHRLALSISQSAEWGMGALQQMCWCLQHWIVPTPRVRDSCWICVLITATSEHTQWDSTRLELFMTPHTPHSCCMSNQPTITCFDNQKLTE